jgi:hypothetical protein
MSKRVGRPRFAKDPIGLGAFQHEHRDFFYAAERNGPNARVCIIHIRAVANIIASPMRPLRGNSADRRHPAADPQW